MVGSPPTSAKRAEKADKLKALREELATREAELRALASINLRLSTELQNARQELAQALASMDGTQRHALNP